MPSNVLDLFSVQNQVVVVTGGGGVLGCAMAEALVRNGAKVLVTDRNEERGEAVAAQLRAEGGQALFQGGDVTDKASMEAVLASALKNFGTVHALINAAGGNSPKATSGPEQSFFDLPIEALRFVTDLNFLGTFLPCQVFGKYLASAGKGTIINISSMAASRPLTRVVGYSASKAAIDNFTRWLAVHMNQNYSVHIRVNAIAPGFLLTEQNRFLLTDQASGDLTERGRTIIAHTPMGRFGDPAELLGCLLWLLSPASGFVNGAVIPVDGGFSAFSGV